MTVTALSSTVVLGSDWHSVSLSSKHSFYLAAIKETKGTADTIDPEKVKRISFELGVDVGASEPLSIGFLTLNFDDFTSANHELNKITAMIKVIGYPTEFKIRPSQIYTDDNTCHKEGTTSISVNLLPVSFK